LLVRDEEEQHDHALWPDVDREHGYEHTHHSAEGGPDHRDQVGQRDEQGDQTGERHAADLQYGVRQHAADRADQQVAEM